MLSFVQINKYTFSSFDSCGPTKATLKIGLVGYKIGFVVGEVAENKNFTGTLTNRLPYA